jgi:hypothetical protein
MLPVYPIFNLDLLLAALITCRWRRSGLMLGVLVVLVAMATAIAALFHFASPIDLLFEPDLPHELDKFGLVREYAGFGLVAAVTLLLFSLPAVRGRSLRWSWILTGITVCLILDSSMLASYLPQTRFGNLNVAGSAGLGLVQYHVLKPPASIQPARDENPLKERVTRWVQRHPGRSVLFVIVESLGLPIDTQLSAWLSERLTAQVGVSSMVEFGSVPFQGSTTAGELRQLCQLKGSYTRLSRQAAATCLPTRLKELGLPSVGIHGFSGRMFQRERWWPRIGLQEAMFLETLSPQFPHQCGGMFRGVCDADLITIAANRLSQGPVFVYVLTLNTHLPITLPQPAAPVAMCRQREIPDRACALLGMHAGFLGRVGELARSQAPAPLIVVVGDHAPPFVEASSRQAFAADKVPYWIITPVN